MKLPSPIKEQQKKVQRKQPVGVLARLEKRVKRHLPPRLLQRFLPLRSWSLP